MASSSWTRPVGTRRRSSKSRPTCRFSICRPYSPELNPQENIWQFLRQTYLSNRVFDGYEAIVDACCQAWNALLGEARRITSIATRTWAAISQ